MVVIKLCDLCAAYRLDTSFLYLVFFNHLNTTMAQENCDDERRRNKNDHNLCVFYGWVNFASGWSCALWATAVQPTLFDNIVGR